MSRFIGNIKLAMPSLIDILIRIDTPTVLIGGMVLEYYIEKGIITKFNRPTTDLDLSIEVVHSQDFYTQVVGDLLSCNYRLSDHYPYRYHPPKSLVKSNLLYVDLLAHTTSDSVDEVNQARVEMGLDKDSSFSFKGMNFATLHADILTGNILIPNPLGFIYLKMNSYRENPQRRRDLGDIVELVYRICKKEEFEQLRGLAESYKEKLPKEYFDLKKLFENLSGDTGGIFDLENCTNDLSHRLINESDESHCDYFGKFFHYFLMNVFD